MKNTMAWVGLFVLFTLFMNVLRHISTDYR